MRVTNFTIHLILFLLLLTQYTSVSAKIIYVDDDGQADFNTIQAAIDDSNDGDVILVAPGTYAGEGNRDIDFKGKAISVESEDPNDPALVALTVVECMGREGDFHRGFIFSSGEDNSSILRGISIVGGKVADKGGAIKCDIGSSPTIVNCNISRNESSGYGGGIYCGSYCNPSILECSIGGNKAESGAGISSYEFSSPKIQKCSIQSNTALKFGGAINTAALGRQKGPIILDCEINDNQAKIGGAIYCGRSNTIVSNSIFSGNIATDLGGVIFCYQSAPSFTNCTIISNHAEGSGGVFNGEGGRSGGDVLFKNCIIWNNSAYEDDIISCVIPDISGSPSVRIAYCCLPLDMITGGYTRLSIEDNNIDFEPLFINPGYWANTDYPNITVEPNDPNAVWIDGDYRLKSQAGRWDPNSESWVQDDVTSPCIDTGDPNSDFSGETWPHGGRINMGAYGGTHEASMSLETGGLFLPRVAYIYSYNNEAAESFESLLEAYGCSTTLLKPADVPTISLDSYDLIIVADDTQYETTWSDPNTIVAIEDSNKPVVGLGDGGYDFFGMLGLSIGKPYGGHGSKNSIEVVDPNSSLFSTPYSIEIPQDRALQLYTETNHIGIYLWPAIPETVTGFGREVDDVGYFPLVAEHNRYLLWGFEGPPDKMTELGKTLFINVVIWTANNAWETEN